MMQIGEYHSLEAYRLTDFGWVLANEDNEEVLLPKTLANETIEQGDNVDVFLFKDSENRLTATMQTPKIRLNEFAFLKVTQINKAGAFLDWGLDKELLLPYREQTQKLVEGQSYVVRLVYDDKTERLFASMRINKYIVYEPITVSEGEKVEVLIYDENPMGYKAIIEDVHQGFIYRNQVFQTIDIGTKITAWVKQIREDGKIDLLLQEEGYQGIPQAAEKILNSLENHDNFLPLHDKSDAREIVETLQMSKKQFKQAIGYLYKRNIINMLPNKGIQKR